LRRSNLTRRPGDCFANDARNDAAFAAQLTSYYYLVLAIGAGEARSPASNRVGAFHFGLTPGAQ
jgi:hypothetical protein